MITACVCTHNPSPGILARCLAALRGQAAPPVPAELVVVDSSSTPALSAADLGLADFPYPARLIREEAPGLTRARIRGLAEARGEVLVYADDDNLLAPDYLVQAWRVMRARPEVGAMGGRNLPLAEVPIPGWFDEELMSYLACLDRGDVPVRLLHERTPYGAGLVVRTEALRRATTNRLILGDRIGVELSSGGDTEMCYRIRIAGWQTWYEPSLRLEHVLPPHRLTIEYLERLTHRFGVDRPRVEFFWYPGTGLRRLSYLRRAAGDLLASWREAARYRPGEDSNANVRCRLDAAFLRGRAGTLFRLALGPPIWRGVPLLDPDS